jgi:hypothetical protein
MSNESLGFRPAGPRATKSLETIAKPLLAINKSRLNGVGIRCCIGPPGIDMQVSASGDGTTAGAATFLEWQT